ncbi:MAG: hypothetical protein C0506_13120 [Anaerolinea sp.]|nr:hypothetical protein [Anaerolinea sp.]
MRLKDKIAAVTGGASGIGKGIAYDFAREGASVVISDIDEAAARQTAAEIAEETGANTLGLRCDVANRAEIDAFVGETVARFGRIDIAVANAGIAILKPTMETSEDDWDRTMDINGKGVFFTDQAVARQMIAQGGGGAIINIASVAALNPSPTLTAYCASKAAVAHMTKCFALELAPHRIRVTSIAPGLVDTPIWGKAMADPNILEAGLRDQFHAAVPLGRMATPEDIANMVTFLASEEGAYLTGHIFVVDGGSALGGPRR